MNENLLYRLPQVLLLGIQCLYILAIPSFLGPKPEAAGFPFSKRIRNSSNAKEFLNVSLTGNGILLIRSVRERREKCLPGYLGGELRRGAYRGEFAE